MRNDPVDMGKLIKALEVSMIHDLPITLVPREAKKLRGELLAWERMVGTLLAEREKYREKYRWVSVEERLPDEGQYVFVHYGSGVRGFDFVVDGRKNYKGVLADNVTHWMPLPEPPESEK